MSEGDGERRYHGRWLRLYAKVLDDPKVQALGDPLFKTWINLLCLACDRDGSLPPLGDIAFRLRLKEAEAKRRLAALVTARLVDESGDGFVMHDWSELQHASDNSAARMRRWRERKRDEQVT